MRKYFLTIFALPAALFLMACDGQYIADKPLTRVEEALPLEELLSLDDMQIHWDDGQIAYASRIEGNVRVLYAIEGDGLREVAVFPPLLVEWGHGETEWCRPQNIFQFDVTDDWIILSVGEIQGSMANFFGDLHRIARDGSGRYAFNLNSFNPSFTIIDGWIYHHFLCLQFPSEWLRIRPDGTDRESLDGIFYTLLLHADGYIYGAHTASGRGSLARWQVENGEPIVLFPEENAPVFEEYNSRIGFRDIAITADYVYFTVNIIGYKEEIGWRPFWQTLYIADFRVNKDGGNLILLQEHAPI